MNKRTKKLLSSYVLLWLLPGVIFLFFFVFDRTNHIPWSMELNATLAIWFGPWATIVAKCTNIPHAGAFFFPWVAIGLTFGLLSTSLLSIFKTNKWITALCIVIYIPLIGIWYFFGWGQMASCLR